MTEAPDWARDAVCTPNPAAKPVESAPKGSAKDRAAAARLRAIERAKSDLGEFSEFGADDFRDGIEPQSSRWDWQCLCFVANFLQTPMVRNWVGGGPGHTFPILWSNLWLHPNRYDPQTGAWRHSNEQIVSIQEVRAAVAARLQELGIDEATVTERLFLSHHSYEESQKWRALVFEQKMEPLRVIGGN